MVRNLVTCRSGFECLGAEMIENEGKPLPRNELVTPRMVKEIKPGQIVRDGRFWKLARAVRTRHLVRRDGLAVGLEPFGSGSTVR